ASTGSAQARKRGRKSHLLPWGEASLVVAIATSPATVRRCRLRSCDPILGENLLLDLRAVAVEAAGRPDLCPCPPIVEPRHHGLARGGRVHDDEGGLRVRL